MQTVTMTMEESKQVCSHIFNRILCTYKYIGCTYLSNKKKYETWKEIASDTNRVEFDELSRIIKSIKEIEKLV